MDGGHYLNEVFFHRRARACHQSNWRGKQGLDLCKVPVGNERSGIAGVGKSKKKIEKIIAAAQQERGHWRRQALG